jgi:hypothetical protein
MLEHNYPPRKVYHLAKMILPICITGQDSDSSLAVVGLISVDPVPTPSFWTHLVSLRVHAICGAKASSPDFCLHPRQTTAHKQPCGRSGSAILPTSGGDIKYQLIMLLFEVAYCARGEYLEDFMSRCEQW